MPNIIDLWTNSAGFAKGIVVILIFMSIWSVSTFIMKWWQLRRSTRETVRFVPEFSRFLQEEHLDAAIAQGFGRGGDRLMLVEELDKRAD